MYQPNIRDDLISRMYHLAKARKVPMTHLINQLLEHSIAALEHEAEQVSDQPAPRYAREHQQKGRK